MELVIDANILMAALIRDSHTRHFLIMCSHKLYSPDYLIEELEKNSDVILDKTGLSKPMLIDLFKQLLLSANITIVPFENYADKLPAARKDSPDLGDAAYFALATKLGCPLWSNDRKLKEQDVIKVYTTEELIFDKEI